jgi:large subunit ribosomal protein L23
MALGNIFKKEKEKKPAVTKKAEPTPVKTAKAVNKKPEKKIVSGKNHRILNIPHVTEKAGDLAEKGQYIFRVFSEANKNEVKKAVESDFGVNVVSVKIVNVRRKKKRLGRIEGFKSGYKKAIVKIKKGQKIELLPR